MSPSDSANGWGEHKALVEWRLKTNEESLGRIEVALVQIQTTLAAMQGSRERRVTALNIVVPAVVALMVLGGEAVIAALLK